MFGSRERLVRPTRTPLLHSCGTAYMPPFAFAELSLDTDARDTRYLAGGNFFGAQVVAPPLRDPVPSLLPSVAEAIAAKAAAASGAQVVSPAGAPAAPRSHH